MKPCCNMWRPMTARGYMFITKTVSKVGMRHFCVFIVILAAFSACTGGGKYEEMRQGLQALNALNCADSVHRHSPTISTFMALPTTSCWPTTSWAAAMLICTRLPWPSTAIRRPSAVPTPLPMIATSPSSAECMGRVPSYSINRVCIGIFLGANFCDNSCNSLFPSGLHFLCYF